MANKTRRSNKESLCENTMKTMANILKLSSLSLAEKSFPTTSKTGKETYGSRKPERIVPITSFILDDEQRSEEPPNNFKLSADPLNPTEKKAVNEKREDIDWLASEYINRFHKNNTSDMKVSSYVIVPPPPLFKLSAYPLNPTEKKAVIEKREDIDWLASEYIDRFHRRIRVT